MNRFYSWIKARRIKQRTYLAILFFDIPGKCLETVYRPFSNIINSSRYIHTVNRERFRKFVVKQNCTKIPVFIIAMPRTMHYLLPCLNDIPGQVKEKSIDIVLIANGLTRWELDFLSSKAVFPVFKLFIAPKSGMSHGHVMNILPEGSRADFAILDHDLYGTTSEMWDQLLSPRPEFIRGLFPVDNQYLNRKFPRTHLLFSTQKLSGMSCAGTQLEHSSILAPRHA